VLFSNKTNKKILKKPKG